MRNIVTYHIGGGPLSKLADQVLRSEKRKERYGNTTAKYKAFDYRRAA